MTATKEILESLENRIRELNQEIATLNAGRAALDGRDSRTAKRPRRSVPAKPPPAPSSKSGTQAPVEAGLTPSRVAAVDASSIAAAQLRHPAQRKRRPGAGRVGEVGLAGRLELLLADTGGLSTSALAERANGNRDQVLTLLRELEAAGRIRRTGQRRSTRWQVITDEERIQERAAELAARSGTAS